MLRVRGSLSSQLTACLSLSSFKEWALTTSIAQWPSTVSEVSS